MQRPTTSKGAIIGGYSRKLGISLPEQVLVTDAGEEINLGCGSKRGNENWVFGFRQAEVLDAAGVEIVEVNGEPWPHSEGQ